ncbi:hypothetical protein BUALT_Bualt09G0032100 [Buddleja alternifolia]|uniref:Uncharacterized protein n=1 Tax=Buddleja alternifolia TaxID=168488 RepID=A0AAV6X0S6_9LAMI|nr:hypothetical protein BUALT_Bualt09G0032100 [Buddleja alternifolia]
MYGKLSPSGKKCIFIRYPEYSKGHVFIGEQVDGSVTEIESRDATFLEEDFPRKGEVSKDFQFYELKDSEIDTSNRVIEGYDKFSYPSQTSGSDDVSNKTTRIEENLEEPQLRKSSRGRIPRRHFGIEGEAFMIAPKDGEEPRTNLVSPTMASPASILSLEKSNSAEDWTIVLPRRGKKNRTLDKFEIPKQQMQLQQWVPIDLETYPERESKLIQKMQGCMQKLENIESFEHPRLQLSLAILMKRKFDWIGEIELSVPIISLVESKVLTSLGCSVLSINEQGRRIVLETTLFFMPHCEAELLETNWGVDQLNRVIVFGNSFSAYEQMCQF